MKSHIHLYLIVVGLFLLLISGSFLTEGIANIGLENGVVAKSIVRPNDFADFWLPKVSDGATIDAHGHLPMGFWIERTLMYLFGDSYLFDKIYSVIIFLLIAVLIVRIWVLIGNTVKTGWLPLAFWLVTPIVSWSATSNLVEGPQTIFVLLAVVSLLHAMRVRRGTDIYLTNHEDNGYHRTHYMISYLWVVLAAIFAVLAFLTKGFSSLFVLAMPIIFWVVGKEYKIRYPIIDTAIIIGVWIVMALAMAFFTDGAYYVMHNYIGHIFEAGRHEQTVASHFYILYALIKQMLIPVLALVIVCLVRLKNNHFAKYLVYWKYLDRLSEDDLRNTRYFYRFIFLALSGVLPIMLVLKQQDYYLITTIPLFAIAFGCIMNNIAMSRLNNLKPLANHILMVLAIVMLTAGVLSNLSSISKYSNDQQLLDSMHVILPHLQEGEVVSVSPELMHNRVAADYFYRYKKIKFDSMLDHQHLITMYMKVEQLETDHYYAPVNTSTPLFKLYEVGEAPLVEETIVEDTMATEHDSIEHDPILHAARIEAAAYDF